MSATELAQAAAALTPSCVKPSDIDTHPDVKAAQAKVDEVDSKLTKAVQAAPSAAGLKAEAEQLRHPDVNRAGGEN